MACSQTKPKGRKRRLLPSDYTEFGESCSVKNQQSKDKLGFSGASDIEKDSLGEYSALNGQKNRTNLLDVSNFHGDLLPLSQAGKFIPKFQTKVIRKIKTKENVRKEGPFLTNVCMENECSTDPESFDVQQRLETHSVNDSKHSPEPDSLLFDEESSKQTADYTRHTFAAVEIAASPLKRKMNLMKNRKLDTGVSEPLSKKKGKGRLPRMYEKTLGIRKVMSPGEIHMNMENNSCSTNDLEGENMTAVSSLESEVVSETLNLETGADADSQNKGFINGVKSNLSSDNMSNIEVKEDFDWGNNRIEAFDQKVNSADAVVESERLELSQKKSYDSKVPEVEPHAALEETENDCNMTNLSQSELNVKSASSGQYEQLDASRVIVSTEIDNKVVNSSQLSTSSNRHSEAGDGIKGSVCSQQADNSCPKISQKTDQHSATMPDTYDQKASDSKKISQHSIEADETNSFNCTAKVTSQSETTPICAESCVPLDAELDHLQNIKLTEKYNAEVVENCGENVFVAELGSLSLGKSTEATTQVQSQPGLLLQKSNDLRQENNLNQPAAQSAHQELLSTFDDFPDVTDSQMYLLDEEGVTKPTLPSLSNMPMSSSGIKCPGLANLSKALDIIASADLAHINDAKRREGNKILQNLIKDLTSVNAQLIQYRRQIEKAKKDRVEHLRSSSCARQY